MGVGRRLRQAREARGLSVSEVAVYTKIPASQLTLLEAEEYARLPGGIFTLGFVRAAARAVGLDPDDLAGHYKEETGATVAAPARPAASGELLDTDTGPRLHIAAEAAPRWSHRPLIAAVLLVISAVLLIAWLGRDRPGPVTDRLQVPFAVETARAAAAVPVAGPVGTSGRGGSPAFRGEGVPLVLEAERTCWVALTVDGERIAYRMLQAGDIVTATMRESATLRTGDAGALRVSVRGKPPVRAGGPGEVRTVVFTRGE